MNETWEFISRSVTIGAGATATIDLWALLLKRFGVSSLDSAFLGRWLGHLFDGQWSHVYGEWHDAVTQEIYDDRIRRALEERPKRASMADQVDFNRLRQEDCKHIDVPRHRAVPNAVS